MERPIDRVRWTGTSDVVVYGSAIAGVARVKAGPVAIGFGIHGDTVSVPLWTAGLQPYILIMPSNVAFGNNAEAHRLLAPRQLRITISTRQEEMAQTMFGVAPASSAAGSVTPYTMVPPCDPDTDPTCSVGGGGYDTDGTTLPAQFTAGYCFGWAAWSVPALDASNDKDTDGLRDGCEY